MRCMNYSDVPIESHRLIMSIIDKSCHVRNKPLLIIRVILSTLHVQRHLEKWEKGLCWYPQFANRESKTLKPIFISMNFQLLKRLCWVWVLLSQEQLTDPLSRNSRPVPLNFPFRQQISGKEKVWVPAMTAASLEVFHPCPYICHP